jgi:hypothetical protein
MKELELDAVRQKYQRAVEDWITLIRAEAELAIDIDSVEAIDDWENAALREEEARKNAKRAKKEYEDALRQAMFNM